MSHTAPSSRAVITPSTATTPTRLRAAGRPDDDIRIQPGTEIVIGDTVPALQERGVYRTAYAGTTLREHLGLRPPLTHPASGRRRAG